MKPIARIRNGELVWQYDGKTIWDLRLRDLNGRLVTVSLDPIRREVTQPQRGWFFGVCVPIIRGQLNTMGGEWFHQIASNDDHTTGITFHLGLDAATEDIKQTLYTLCGNVGPEGEYRTLSQMSTSEFNDFKSKIQRVVHVDLDGLYIPDPNERCDNE